MRHTDGRKGLKNIKWKQDGITWKEHVKKIYYVKYVYYTIPRNENFKDFLFENKLR